MYKRQGLIRLAYFNVMEEKRQNETSENRKYYQGLPITSMSVVLPLLFVVSLLFPEYKWFVVQMCIRDRYDPRCDRCGDTADLPVFPV